MEFIKHSVLTLLFPIFSWYLDSALGHARLLEPAGRSSLWRFNYKTPVNYNDNQLFCGGYRVCIAFCAFCDVILDYNAI